MKIMVFDNHSMSQALVDNLYKELGMFIRKGEENIQLVFDFDLAIEKFEKEKISIIIINLLNIETITLITRIRNNQSIKNQPIVIAIVEDPNLLISFIKMGANLWALPDELAGILLGTLYEKEMTSVVEDWYSEVMSINKRDFYREYKDKLQARSEITADTEKELEILTGLFNQNNVKNVLDAGGGEGRIAIPLSQMGYEVTNLDLSEDLLNKLKEKTDKVKALHGNLEKIELEDDTQDAITFNWHVLCDLLGNKAKRLALSEAYRILKHGGIIALDIPDREYGELHNDGVYINSPGGDAIFIGYVPDKNEMKSLLEEAGFVDIECNKWKTKEDFPKLSFSAKK